MRLLESLLQIVAPFSCIVCNTEGSLLCRWCFPGAFPAVPPRCYRCFKMTVEHAACRSCRRQVHLQYVWVVTEYDVLAKDLLWRLKFSRARAAAVVVARILDERLPYFTPDTIISHIPTATSRFRARGYDHATLIAKELARQRNVRHCTLLARMGQTRQVGAKRAQRRHQLQGAFRAVPARLDPKTPVVLIDDVLTTGATIEAATAVLRAAGLKSVRAAVFAQKIQT